MMIIVSIANSVCSAYYGKCYAMYVMQIKTRYQGLLNCDMQDPLCLI